MVYPDGRATTFRMGRDQAPTGETWMRGPGGTSDRLEMASAGHLILHLSDGGQVFFNQFDANNHLYRADQIANPYGQMTKLFYEDQNNVPARLIKVVEPAGRYLQFTYQGYFYSVSRRTISWSVLGQVTGYTSSGVVASQVNFTYQFSGSTGRVPYLVLAGANYVSEPSPTNASGYVQALYYPTAGTSGAPPLLERCYDPHYAGPMANIAYLYDTTQGAAYGTIAAETHAPTTQANTQEGVTSLYHPDGNTAVETRADGGFLRTFRYAETATTPFPVTNAKGYQLTSFTDFKNDTNIRTFYAYNGPGDPHGYGYLQAVQDRKGNVTNFVTGPFTGKTVQVTLPAAVPGGPLNTRRFVYGYANNPAPYYLTEVWDERNQVPTFYYRNAANLVYQINYSDNTQESFTFDSFDVGNGPVYRVTTHTNQRGGIITNHYEDARFPNLVTSVDRPHGTGLQGERTGTDTSYFEYDALGRLLSVHDSRVGGAVETFAYNGRHQVTAVTHADNKFVLTTYDDYGNAYAMRDELGHVTYTEHDDYRRPTRITEPVNRNGITNRVTTLSYDHTISYTYGAYTHTMGVPGTVITPSGRGSMNYFRENGWINATTGGMQADANGQLAETNDSSHTGFDYDVNGQRTSVNRAHADPYYAYVTLSTYDGRGRLASTQEPNGVIPTYAYDAAGNLVSVTPPVDTQANPNQTPTLFADPTSPDSPANPLNYDPMNRRRSTLDARGKQTLFAYDLDGQLAAVTDANSHTTTFTYDLLGRRRAVVYPSGDKEAWTYDATGNVATYKNRSNSKQSFTYDNRNRLTGAAWDDNSAPAVTNFAYDDAGRLTSHRNTNSQLDYFYDDAGRPYRFDQTVAGGTARSILREPNADGLTATLGYPGGTTLSQEFTSANLVRSVGYNGGTTPSPPTPGTGTAPAGRTNCSTTSTLYWVMITTGGWAPCGSNMKDRMLATASSGV